MENPKRDGDGIRMAYHEAEQRRRRTTKKEAKRISRRGHGTTHRRQNQEEDSMQVDAWRMQASLRGFEALSMHRGVCQVRARKK